MRSQVIDLAEGSRALDVLRDRAVALEEEGPPAFLIAFLPSGDGSAALVRELGKTWPGAVRVGCETVTQFSGSRVSSAGAVQLFWLDSPSSSVGLEVVTADAGTTDLAPLAERLAGTLAAADGALMFADGIRFPSQRFLDEVRVRSTGFTTPIAGAIASQVQPVVEGRPGARVFAGEELLESGCVVLVLRGISLGIEVVNGWSPVSPVYEVSRAEGSILWEIEGQSATEWYRKFFTVGEGFAPMPESSYAFPLIIEGPLPERHGLVRSMRAFNEPEGAVSYWGDLRAGDKVRLGMGDGGSLVEAAATRAAGAAPEAAVLFSCVGREVVLGEDCEREVVAIQKALGGVALSGFFSFGEIGPSARGRLAFYNQTAILALLRETSR